MRDASRAAEISPTKYEVLRSLASGGMAEIFLARTRESNRLVVLKKLHPRLSIESEHVQMFRDEAVIASKLQHPNLVEVYELGLAGEEHYIAMEHLHGHDLSRTLRRMRHQRVPLMFQQAITIVRDVAAGLHYAHERVDDDGNLFQIIHRDVSPHNVFLTFRGEVKVVDFGIAKANSVVGRTRTGVLKGKAAYMSPEQALGEALDRRTDVFSMGILLWELTTGRWLYRRKSELETLKAVVEFDAPKPSTVRPDYPKDLEKIVMKTLERPRENRWATAGELRAALDELARSWKFRPGPSHVGKLMSTVYPDELAAWEKARDAGVSLGDHLAAVKPEVVEPNEDALDTDPEEIIALETRRGSSMESNDLLPRTRTRQGRPTLRLREGKPWWRRHQRVLIASLVAGLVLGLVASLIAALVHGQPPRRKNRSGEPSSSDVPLTETLDLNHPTTPPTPPTPPDQPTSSGSSTAPSTGSSKVPIFLPPPLPDKKPGREPSPTR
ncbi:MAG TPA: serine/threonine-protein kinase [Kofleriaceae bacterium]|nr:serine/threonine-protein kinase [Kofleriaceae bacterium]